jgi:gamma-glutamyltranspeptidase/glutathione hydrolase
MNMLTCHLPRMNKAFLSGTVTALVILGGCEQRPEPPTDYIVTEKQPNPAGVKPIELSPMHWPEEVLYSLMERNSVMGGSDGLATGGQGAIAATTGAPAVNAGLEALKQGGNAIDAVITTSLAQIALATGAWVSYAGIFEMMYFDAASGEVYNLNAGYNTVLREKDPASIPAEKDASGNPTPSGRTALVPGYFAGIQAAHDRFGSLPFKSLFDPAIYFAKQGFELNSIHSSMIERRKDVLSRRPDTKAIFTRADGSFYTEGDVIRQPELANTLKIVSELGSEYIYRGPWAERLVEAVQSEGGKLTLEDLAKYEVIWQEPIRYEFNEFTLYLHGAPAQGGTHLAESLNLVKESGLASMGDYRQDPEAFYWFSQLPNSFATSFIPVSMSELVFPGLDTRLEARSTSEHAATLWKMIQEGQFIFAVPPAQKDPKHSDAIVVIDQWGNMAAVTHTINTSAWGGTGIFVDGISIPDSAAFQQTAIAETYPGNRLPDPTEPLLVFRHGKPLGAFSSIGAGLHQKTFTVLFNLINHGASLKEALDAPSTHLPAFDSSNYLKPPVTQVVEGEFSPQLLTTARELGLEVNEFGKSAADRAPRGYVVGAMIRSDGQREAMATKLFNAPAMAH